MKISDSTKQAIIELVDNRFSDYVNSTVYQNWKLQAEICRDAVNQKWRAGEQLTRSGFYFAALAATRDGWHDGLIDIFAQANPIMTFRPRAGLNDAQIDSAQNLFANAWDDSDGLTQWMALLGDAVDYGMGVSYVSWCKGYAFQQVPKLNMAWGDMLEWTEEFAETLARTDIARIHPLNYRADYTRASRLTWEGAEWEITVADLMEMQGNPNFDGEAIQRVLDKTQKGDFGEGSGTFYSSIESQTGGKKAFGKPLYAKEYWGDLQDVPEYAKYQGIEYAVYIVAGEIIRLNVNPIVIKQRFRPFQRTRLIPMADAPMGKNVLAPTMPHQKIKNLILNLGIDDVVMRQHLGLAVWPDQLKNPNDLLNPEGARGVMFMKQDANPNLLPRFFADTRSGTLSDALQMNGEIERDSQLANLNQQTLGLDGGQQGATATASRYLASNGSRRLRIGAISASHTGLKPITQHMMLLTLKNNPPEDLRIDARTAMDLLNNNVWEVSDTVRTDPAVEFTALSQFGQIAMQQMGQMAPQDGNMNHMVEFMKDTARALRIPSMRMDKYFPKQQMAPQVQTAPTPQSGIAEPPPELPPELRGTRAGDMVEAPLPEEMVTE